LKERPSSNGKVGAIGFCSGGRQAYLAASQVKEVSAVVDCWGVAVVPDDRFTVCEDRPVAPIETTADIRVPVLGIFGNDDKSPSPAEVGRIETELRRHRKFYEIYRYHGAGHGFWTTTSANYRAEQAQDSWLKATQFFTENLT
jgi:carboxymethylenebutenolidase